MWMTSTESGRRPWSMSQFPNDSFWQLDLLHLSIFKMNLHLAALLALLPLALAAKSLKSVVITFPNETPSSVISQAKDTLVASVRTVSLSGRNLSIYLYWPTEFSQGGVITHEYRRFYSQFPFLGLPSLTWIICGYRSHQVWFSPTTYFLLLV